MIGHLAILAVALGFLAKSADWFVEYAARLAQRFGVSDLLVGLTITAVGTSMPELATALSAALRGHPELVVGSVVGSNIANIGLVLGVAAIVRPFATHRRMHYRDGFVMLAAAGLLFALSLDNELGRVEASAFLLLHLVYLIFVAQSDRSGDEARFSQFIEFFLSLEYLRSARSLVQAASDTLPGKANGDGGRRHAMVELGIVLAAGIGIIVSAHFVVREAVWLATRLEVSEEVIGLSMIAFGTSLPELTVAVAAATKGRGEIVVGSVIGSNIANTLLVMGACGLVGSITVPESSVATAMPIMIFFSIGLLYLIKSGWQVTRPQGLLAFACYLVFIFGAVS